MSFDGLIPSTIRRRVRIKKWVRKIKDTPPAAPDSDPGSNPFSSSSSAAVQNDNNDNKTFMNDVLGLLRIRIKKGINLAVRDHRRRKSDPYVVVKMGHQKVKTRVVRQDVNPQWDDDLTLTVSDPTIPVRLKVYDHDTFTKDDKMGSAEIHIKPFIESVKTKDLKNLPSGTILFTEVADKKSNCLSKDSCVIWKDGQLLQDMCVKLQNVECGELELQLRWIFLN